MADRIAFVTDSTTLITPDLETRLGTDLFVAPLNVSFPEGTVMPDGSVLQNPESKTDMELKEIMTIEQFLELINAYLITSSQPNPHQFETVYRKALKDHDVVVGLVLSNEISKTYENGLAAAGNVPGRYWLPQTRGLSVLTTLMLEEALKYDTLPQIQEAVSRVNAHAQAFQTVDNLMFYKRSGRLSRAEALFGNLLGIKPIITMDMAGQLVPYGKVRTAGKAAAAIGELILEKAPGGRYLIVHAGMEAPAAILAEKIGVPATKLVVFSLPTNSGPYAAAAGLRGDYASLPYEMLPQELIVTK